MLQFAWELCEWVFASGVRDVELSLESCPCRLAMCPRHSGLHTPRVETKTAPLLDARNVVRVRVPNGQTASGPPVIPVCTSEEADVGADRMPYRRGAHTSPSVLSAQAATTTSDSPLKLKTQQEDAFASPAANSSSIFALGTSIVTMGSGCGQDTRLATSNTKDPKAQRPHFVQTVLLAPPRSQKTTLQVNRKAAWSLGGPAIAPLPEKTCHCERAADENPEKKEAVNASEVATVENPTRPQARARKETALGGGAGPSRPPTFPPPQAEPREKKHFKSTSSPTNCASTSSRTTLKSTLYQKAGNQFAGEWCPCPVPATGWMELGHSLVATGRVYLVYVLVAVPVSVLACSAALGLLLLLKPELKV